MEGLLSLEESIRLGAVMYVATGVVTIGSTLLPEPAAMNRAGVILVGVAAILLGLLGGAVPWQRLGHGGVLWATVPGFAMIGMHNDLGGVDAYRYGVFFVIIFVWVGISQPRGASLYLLPLLVAAYLLPLWATGHWSAEAASSVLYVAAICVLVCETLAWAAQRLAVTAHELAAGKQTELALREQAQAAEQLAALQSDFVSAVSHELRTPLASIMGYAELMQMYWDSLDEPRRKHHLDRIVNAASRQHRLIEDLLRVSRLESSDLALRPEPIQVTALIARTAELVRSSYHDQVIETDGPSEAYVLADVLRAEQVLTNVLDNAAKYSPDGSPIRVSWSEDQGHLAIRVLDLGPGIPDSSRDVLFTRFGRVPGSRMRAGRVGTGLGLYLGRAYAEAMGGTLCLESTGSGGSTFCLRLPAWQGSQTQAQTGAADTAVLGREASAAQSPESVPPSVA